MKSILLAPVRAKALPVVRLADIRCPTRGRVRAAIRLNNEALSSRGRGNRANRRQGLLPYQRRGHAQGMNAEEFHRWAHGYL